MPKLRCLKPPIIKDDEKINISCAGEVFEVSEITHYWQGQIARNAVEVVETETEAEVVKPKSIRARKGR
jgi:hypothetical protein